MRHTTAELRKLLAPTKFPCWPNPSRLTLLLTRDLRKLISYYIIPGTVVACAAAFTFETPTNNLLRLIGYNDDFVSSFAFFNKLYSYLSAIRITSSLSTANFHILDIFLWWSIVIWVTRLTTGAVFLKQYDDFFQALSSYWAERFRAWRYVLYILAVILAVFGPFVIIQPRIILDPEFSFVIRHYPKVYFWSISVGYFVMGLFLIEFFLFFLWKTFRQHWPGVILWHAETQRRELGA